MRITYMTAVMRVLTPAGWTVLIATLILISLLTTYLTGVLS